MSKPVLTSKLTVQSTSTQTTQLTKSTQNSVIAVNKNSTSQIISSSQPTISIGSTPFDRYISGMGLSSLRPEIISFLDFENFYSGDAQTQLTGTGQIYYIQRRVAEQTVSAAAILTNEYLKKFPKIKESLTATSVKNQGFVKTILSNMLNFQSAKQDFYKATFDYVLTDSFDVKSPTSIGETPSIKYEAVTSFDDSKSDIEADLNAKFMSSNEFVIDDISRSSQTVDLLRIVASRIEGMTSTGEKSYIKFTGDEGSSISTKAHGTTKLTLDSNSYLDFLTRIDDNAWITAIDNGNSLYAEYTEAVESDLTNLTNIVINDIAKIITERDESISVDSIVNDFVGNKEVSKELSNTTFKINPTMTFGSKTMLVQDILGDSASYASLLSMLVNNASTENITTVDNKLTELENNVVEFRNKMSISLRDDIGVIFYNSLYSSFSSYIETSFLGDEEEKRTLPSNSSFRFFIMMFASSDVLARMLGILMIRNTDYIKEETGTTISSPSKNTSFNSIDFLVSIPDDQKKFTLGEKGSTNSQEQRFFELFLDKEEEKETSFEPIVDTAHTSFDVIYDYTITFLDMLKIDKKLISEELFRKIMIIIFFHFRKILSVFINRISFNVVEKTEEIVKSSDEATVRVTNKYVRMVVKNSLSYNEVAIINYLLYNFSELTNNPDEDFLTHEASLISKTTYEDHEDAEGVLETVMKSFHQVLFDSPASYLNRQKGLRQTLDFVLSRIKAQKSALNNILISAKNIEKETGDATSAEKYISLYFTPESTFQLYNKLKRMTSIIPAADTTVDTDTVSSGISTEIFTPNSYESLINTTSKFTVSKYGRVIIVAVGIPYGLYEMLRINNKKSDYANKFILNLYVRNAMSETSDAKKISFVIDPNIKVSLDYTSGNIVTNLEAVNGASPIQFDILKTDGSKVIQTTNIDLFENTVNIKNALGETYFEEVLGLFPRNAFKKEKILEIVPETKNALDIVSNLKFKPDESELLKSRYAAVVMNHTLFNSTSLINNLKESFAFDDVRYAFINLDGIDIDQNEIIQITANIDISKSVIGGDASVNIDPSETSTSIVNVENGIINAKSIITTAGSIGSRL